MPAKKTEPEEMVEIVVQGDNHIHQGKPVKKGTKINVGKDVAAMLEKAWKAKAKGDS